MLRQISSFIDNLVSETPPAALDKDEIPVACAALLVHCAHADGHKSQVEDQKLCEVLTEHYGLAPKDAEVVIADAENRQAEAIDLHRFTRVLHRNLDRDGRMEIVRLLWEITHADGTIDHDERSAVALVARLMNVEVKDAVALRHNVTGGSADT